MVVGQKLKIVARLGGKQALVYFRMTEYEETVDMDDVYYARRCGLVRRVNLVSLRR